jgi:hypothetical protein
MPRRTPLLDAPIEQPPGLRLNHTSRCQIAPETHRLWPTLVSQSWTAGGREAKIYQQRQQPARHSPRKSVRTTPRSGTSPRLRIEHAGTALKANIPLRMSLCNKLHNLWDGFQLSQRPSSFGSNRIGTIAFRHIAHSSQIGRFCDRRPDMQVQRLGKYTAPRVPTQQSLRTWDNCMRLAEGYRTWVRTESGPLSSCASCTAQR